MCVGLYLISFNRITKWINPLLKQSYWTQRHKHPEISCLRIAVVLPPFNPTINTQCPFHHEELDRLQQAYVNVWILIQQTHKILFTVNTVWQTWHHLNLYTSTTPLPTGILHKKTQLITHNLLWQGNNTANQCQNNRKLIYWRENSQNNTTWTVLKLPGGGDFPPLRLWTPCHTWHRRPPRHRRLVVVPHPHCLFLSSTNGYEMLRVH